MRTRLFALVSVLVIGVVITWARAQSHSTDPAVPASTRDKFTPIQAVPAEQNSAQELAGLWKAKRRFGPDARGPLIIQKDGDAYIADIVGRRVSIRMDKGELTFDLPDNQGTFRGKLEAKNILGHWFRPGTLVNGAGSTSPVAASPVVLRSDGPNRWSGNVDPPQDEFTFYLMVGKRPDGSVGILLRNPQRDYGNQIGVERLTREGNVVKLIGKRRGQTQDRELATGTYDPADEVLTLVFPNRGLSYDFMREGDESDFYSRGKNPDRYSYRLPPARDDGWPTGTLEEANIDRAAIEKLIQIIIETAEATLDTPQIHGILIARHGKMVLEEYFHGFSRDVFHDTRSASKSVTATLVGAAMQAGAPLKLSRWVVDYPYKERKVKAFQALGAGGQNVTVIPDLDLVIASFSGSYASRGYGRVTGELIPKNILPAVREGTATIKARQ